MVAGHITVSVESLLYAIEALADTALANDDQKDAAGHALRLLDLLKAARVGTCVELVREDLERVAWSVL